MRDVKLSIAPDGTMRFIYADDLRPLLETGAARIDRASHVEPVRDAFLHGGTMWEADLSPVSGPVLGPYTTRQEALDAEVEWLNQNLGALHVR